MSEQLSSNLRHQPRKVFSAERQSARHEAPAPSAPPAAVAATVVADNREVLDAIARLEEKLTRTVDIEPEVQRIQVEISEIAGRIKATKVEMAALRHPLMEENRFKKAAEQLDEIVQATERATTSIIDQAEKIDELANEMRSLTEDSYIQDRLGQLNDIVMQIYEACNFQDLTGQKIRKVVGTLQFIEDRVDSMLSMWNQSELATMPMPPELDRVDGEVTLHGPDLTSSTSSQADIDALFD